MRKKNWKKGMALLMAGCMSAVMFAGCSGGEAGPATENQGTVDQNTEGASQLVGKDSIVVATPTETVGLYVHDDAYPVSSIDYIVDGSIYDTLFYMDENGEIKPRLAKSYEISEDGKTYTIELQDAKFSNGDEVIGEDIAFSLDKASESGQSSLIVNYLRTDVISDKKVQIILSDVYAPFLNGLASRAGYIVDKSYYDEVGSEGYQNAPVGSGPYKVISRTSGDNIKLEYNDFYWGDEPSIKSVEIRVVSDPNSMMVALESGQVDVAIAPAASTVSMLQQGSGVTWNYCDSAARSTIVFNAAPGSLSENKDFRRAIQYAIEKDSVLIAATEGYGKVTEIDISTSFSGYSDTYNYVTAEYNVEKAKEYLAASGYNGQEFTVLCVSGTSEEAALAVVQNQLQQIGVNMSIVAVDNASFFEALLSDTTDAYLKNSVSSLGDASSMGNNFCSSTYKKIWYDRLAEMDELKAKADSNMNNEERGNDYGKLSDIVIGEAYGIPLFYNASIIAYSENLKGVTPHPQYSYRIEDWNW